MRTNPRIPNATDLRALYECDTDTLAIVSNGDGTTIVEIPMGHMKGHAVGRIQTALASVGCQRLGDWWAPGYEHGQIGHEEGPREIACYVSDVDQLTLLRAAWVWARDNGGCVGGGYGGHQVEEWLDNYLVDRGQPTVVHAPVTT